MTKAKWVRPEENKDYKEGLARLQQENTYHLSPKVIEFLYNRGVRDAKELEQIVDTTADRELSPYDLADIDKAVAEISRIIQEKKKIVIYGDYDCDGVCASVIAIQALRNLGADVDYYINSRFVEGYGITPLGVDNLLKKIPDAEVIITVDNGIVAFEGVAYAQEKGLEVLITDHHLAIEEIPEALAVVNPHRLDDESLFKDVCGATVIYKVMLALYWELGEDIEFISNMIDLVGMATVGDVMPLRSENRFYVNEALRLIEQNSRKQFEVLKKVKNVGVLNEEVFGFQFVPTINAEGRLNGKPTLAMEFFLSEDENEMHSLAHELGVINDDRKDLTKLQEELGESLMAQQGSDKKVIVIFHPDFHSGIVGLVAGRLKEKYNRPVIVFTEENGILKGSSRSIEGFHIKDALDKVSDLILQHGGHALAAGLSIDESNLDAFSVAINELADQTLTAEDMVEKIMVDAVLDPADVTLELIHEIDSLRPFGQGFESPVFGLSAFDVDKVIYMGDGSHLKLVNFDTALELVMFKHADNYREMGEPTRVKALGTPKINSFRGNISIQFNVNGNCVAQ